MFGFLFTMNRSIDNSQAIDVKKFQKTAYPILFAIAFSHLLNDLLQIIIPSIYPILRETYSFSFTQIGFITFVYQVTASLLQPVVGMRTDKKPMPYSLAFGMGFTMLGLIFLSFANTYAIILLAVGLVGIGSSIFHPEASRVAYLASGGKRGLAQAIFQVGGNTGTAVGPPVGDPHRNSLWTNLYTVVLGPCHYWNCLAFQNRTLVPKPFDLEKIAKNQSKGIPSPLEKKADKIFNYDLVGLDFFEIHLYDEHQ